MAARLFLGPCAAILLLSGGVDPAQDTRGENTHHTHSSTIGRIFRSRQVRAKKTPTQTSQSVRHHLCVNVDEDRISIVMVEWLGLCGNNGKHRWALKVVVEGMTIILPGLLWTIMTTTMVQHLISPASLPASKPGKSLSVLTYNVLLPNSQDGWWNYKMYSPALQQQGVVVSSSSDAATTTTKVSSSSVISTWEYRRNLLQERIGLIHADVVCLQEVAPDTFEQDFGFMTTELGYDGVVLYQKKGRFRPATFWKTSVCHLASPAVHKDRSIITAFQLVHNNNDDDDADANADATKKHPCWYVVNVHLQAGKQGPRRFRQIQEAMKGVITLSRKLQPRQQSSSSEQNNSSSLRLIVCGDMNGGAECGAIRYLEDGQIDENWLEDGEPVTTSRKDLPLPKPLLDATMAVHPPRPCPPTLVVAELMQSLMHEPTYESPVFSQAMIDRLTRIFHRLASSSSSPHGTTSSSSSGDGVVMTRHHVEEWLIQINGRLGRGDEYRNAALEMGWIDTLVDDDDNNAPSWEERKRRIQLPTDGVLTLSGFINVYRKELEGGKFWGIAHDMAVLGDPLPDLGLFQARYDRIYHSAALVPTAVLDTLSDKPCPNEQEPSDHLPVAVSFQAVAS
jgi:hypothetical protein